MELATQIGAFVGTSVLLYIITTPKVGMEDGLYRNNNNNINSMECCLEVPRPQRLRGIKKYSSYHRKKMYASLSKMSVVSSESSLHGSSEDNSSVYSLASSSSVSNNEDAASR